MSFSPEVELPGSPAWISATLAEMGLTRGRIVTIRDHGGIESQGRVGTVLWAAQLGPVAVVLETETWRPRPKSITIPWAAIQAVTWL